MGVFGIPSHEDDALRAVRAAAGIQRALQELNEELDQRYGVRLQARIGVNTGEVVADDPDSGDSFLVGDAVNLAARLEQLAEPDQILLGSETHALVCDAVDAERVETVQVKGKSEPVTAYRLIEIKADSLGHVRRVDPRLVGREP